jgi:hypothetical protein
MSPGERRSGPADHETAASPNHTQDTAAARRAWATAELGKLHACEYPRVAYGSPEFFDYPGPVEHAPAARLAALIVAAEAWATDGDTLVERLATEVGASRDAWQEFEESVLADMVWPEIARRAKASAIRAIEVRDARAKAIAKLTEAVA